MSELEELKKAYSTMTSCYLLAENDLTTCREDWRHLYRFLEESQQKRISGSRDFGRGYALAIKDIKAEMSRLGFVEAK